MTICASDIAFIDFRFNFFPTAIMSNHFRYGANLFDIISVVKFQNYRVGFSAVNARMRSQVFNNFQCFFLPLVFIKNRVMSCVIRMIGVIPIHIMKACAGLAPGMPFVFGAMAKRKICFRFLCFTFSADFCLFIIHCKQIAAK